MTAAVPSTSASLLPVSAARPLARKHRRRERFRRGESAVLLTTKVGIISYLWDFSPVLSDVHAGGYGYDPPRWFGEEDLPMQ
ncbi:hypothetical protein C2845_PM17G15250 [Panicum miliaceum]|uniref:Uncharacterized protein n=1 Tax=Panicum miliaceum TaxID=4540 RepID=A0A3L6Q127_PANMI|nr:hypothetical protein C2845_PM17G15250 [Panicum miliaceum]